MGASTLARRLQKRFTKKPPREALAKSAHGLSIVARSKVCSQRSSACPARAMPRSVDRQRPGSVPRSTKPDGGLRARLRRWVVCRWSGSIGPSLRATDARPSPIVEVSTPARRNSGSVCCCSLAPPVRGGAGEATSDWPGFHTPPASSSRASNSVGHCPVILKPRRPNRHGPMCCGIGGGSGSVMGG